MLHKILPILVLITATLFGDPIPTASVNDQPGTQLVGETFSQELCFDNTGNQTGFEPQFEVVTPPGITITGASFYGSSTLIHSETCATDDCNVTNPHIPTNYSPVSPLDANQSFYVLDYPVGSFTTELPKLCMDVDFAIDNVGSNITLGVEENISVSPIFVHGDTASGGTPIYGSSFDVMVIPNVYTIEKDNSSPEGERATGPSHPITVTLLIDIAHNETVDNLIVTDVLSGGMQFVSVTNAGVCTATTTPSTSTPGGNLIFDCGSYTGALNNDITITYEYYIPEFDDTNTSIIGMPGGDWQTLTNEVKLNGDSNTTGQSLPEVDDNSTVIAKAMVIQKYSSLYQDNNFSGFGPGDIVQYTLHMETSDYYRHDNINLSDLLGDGQHFIDNNSTYIPKYSVTDNNGTGINLSGNFNASNYSECNVPDPVDGSCLITFDLSTQISNPVLTGPATINITFYAKIDESYKKLYGGKALAMGDIVDNRVTVYNDINGTGGRPDSSYTYNQINESKLVKSVYKVNGSDYNTSDPLVEPIKPGDEVTYRLRTELSADIFYDFNITDYLPIPIFEASQMNTAIGDGNISGQWGPGPDNNFHNTPTLTINTGQNSLRWSFGDDFDINDSSTLDIIFTVTATNAVMVDGLSLANLAFSEHHDAKGDTITDGDGVNIKTGQPDLEMEKQIIASTNGLVPIGGTGSLSDVDANDTITYRVAITNIGHYTAFDINLTDTLNRPAMTCDESSIVLDSNGSLPTYTGLLFSPPNKITIDHIDALSYLYVEYNCTVHQDANPGADIDNTAVVSSFSSINGGPDFLDDNLSDSTNLILAENASLTKTLYDSSLPSTTGKNLNPGEIAHFEMNATLGEGTYFDFNITDVMCDSTPVLTAQSANANFSGSDLEITGTTGTSTGWLTYRCEYQTKVADIGTQTNTATMDATNMSPITATEDFTVTPPNPNTSKVMNPAVADSGDLIEVVMDWESNTTANPSYQCTVTDQLDPLFNWSTILITETPSGYNCTADTGTGVVTCVFLDENATCGDGAAKFTVNINDNIIIGGTLVNTVEFEGKTLPKSHVNENNNTYNGSTDENATANLNLRTPARPVKIFTATSEDFTDPGDLNLNSTPAVAIGEVIDVNITYAFYEGTTLDVSLEDRFMNGGRLVYVPNTMMISRGDGNISVANTDINSTLSTTPSSVADSNLTITNNLISLHVGDVTNINSSAGISTSTLTLSFRVKVQNEVSVQEGELVRNRGRVRYTDSVTNSTRNAQSPITSVRAYEPRPTINKEVNQTAVEAGTLLEYKITVCNDETNTSAFVTSGFDWNVTDTVPSDILPTGVFTVSNPANVSVAINGQELNATITRLDPGECEYITYDAVVQLSAQFGQVMVNTAKFETTSLPGEYGSAGDLGVLSNIPGANNGERIGTDMGPNDLFGVNSEAVTMRSVSIKKELIDAKQYYAIGEQAHYRITIDLLPGSANNFIVTDNLPIGLDLDGSDVAYTSTGGTVTNPTFDLNSTSNIITFDYGDINVTVNTKLEIDMNVTVTNILTNQDGIGLTNDANVTFDDPNNPGETVGTSPALPAGTVNVGEPNLFMQKSITSGTTNVQAGSVVSWAVTIVNNGNTPAYAVNWLDILPEHIAQISNATLTQGGNPAVISGSLIDINSSHLQITNSAPSKNDDMIFLPLFDLPVGTIVTMHFDSIVENDAIAGETLTNDTNVSYNSIIGGDGTELGGRDSSNCGDDDNDTTLNNYCESAIADLVISSEIDIDKKLQGTNDKFTIGEEVVYDIRVTLIDGITPNVVLTDTLPSGLTYVSHTCQDAGGTFMSFDCNLTGTSPVTIDFGDVSNPSDGNTNNNYIDVELTVLVENVIGNQNAYIPTNGGNSTLVNVVSDVNTSTVTIPVPVTLIEPDLNVAKAVLPGTQALGDIVTYTVNLSHTAASTSDAFDVNFTDTLDTGLVYIPGSATGATVTDVGQVLTFSFAHLANGDSRTIMYKARIADTVAVGVDLNNSLDTVFSGLADANGTVNGGRNGSGGVNDYNLNTVAAVTPNNAELNAVKSLRWEQNSHFDRNNDTVVSAGDLLEYKLSVVNPYAYAVGELNVIDYLDENVTLMLNSIRINGNNVANDSASDWTVSGYWYTFTNSDVNISYNGDTNYFEVYWKHELAANGGTFDVTFDVKINDGGITSIAFVDTTSLDVNRSQNTKVIGGTVINNIFTVDSNRTVPTDSNEVNETVEERVAGIIPPFRGKEITATDQNFTTPVPSTVHDVAVGEIIDIALKVETLGGITREVYIRDNFDPTQFVYVPDTMRLIRSSTSLTVSQPDLNNSFGSSTLDIAVDDSNITHDGNGFEISLGDFTNSNYTPGDKESLMLTFRLRVDNSISVQQGNILSDHGSITYLEFNPDTNTSAVKTINTKEVNVTAVEPLPEVSKTVNPISATVGDELTYMLKVCNNESNAASAHATSGFEWTVADTLRYELDFNTTAGFTVNTYATGATVVPNIAGQDITATIDRLDSGECIDISYKVTINGTAEFEQDINNSVRVETTSLPDPLNPYAVERTGTNNPAINDLNNTSTAIVSIDAPAVLKAVVGQKPYYPIGDIVDYNITLGFTGSARDLVITDHFPRGMSYVPNSAVLTVPAGANVTNPNPIGVGGARNDVSFYIGDLNVTTSGNMYLTLSAIVEDTRVNVGGLQLTNVVDVTFRDPNSGETVDINATADPITIGEPHMRVIKTNTSDMSIPKGIGDTISYQIEIQNIGTTIAYHVKWEDHVPKYTADIQNAHQQVLAGTAYQTGTTVAVTDNNFTYQSRVYVDDFISLEPFDLSPSGRIVITFDTIIQSDVVLTEILVNETGAVTQSLVDGGRSTASRFNGESYGAGDKIEISLNQL
ncbi:MAG: isopeptide-forming domain-containing fimbrial protein, partial [Chlamydiia bacterium]|nr:isopeptide-forming domain-containing fimbrial protein [Chlamydiia bacterium]